MNERQERRCSKPHTLNSTSQKPDSHPPTLSASTPKSTIDLSARMVLTEFSLVFSKRGEEIVSDYVHLHQIDRNSLREIG